MSLVHWLFLLASAGVLALGVYLYALYPSLVLPTPWGPWPFYLVLPALYLLGFLLGGAYALVLWGRGWARARALRRDLEALRREVQALRQKQIEEIPRIPDRLEEG